MANRITELRKRKRMSQTALGLEIGTSQQTVSRIELDIRDASLDLLMNIADFFNVTLDYLTGRSDISARTEAEISIRKSLDENQAFTVEFAKLEKANKKAIMRLVKSLVEKQEKDDKS